MRGAAGAVALSHQPSRRCIAATSARGVLPVLPVLVLLVLLGCAGIPAAHAGKGAMRGAKDGMPSSSAAGRRISGLHQLQDPGAKRLRRTVPRLQPDAERGVKSESRGQAEAWVLTYDCLAVSRVLNLRGGKDAEDNTGVSTRFTDRSTRYPKCCGSDCQGTCTVSSKSGKAQGAASHDLSAHFPREKEFGALTRKMHRGEHPSGSEFRAALRPTPVSSVRDLIHVGKARELETLVLIDMIKHQKVPNSEEQRAEIEAMEHEAEGLEKLYREGQGGYWLKYPNGTISTHRLSFKEYRHQLRSDIKYVPKLLKIHEKTAKMHLEHVKLRQRILGWGNTTVADSAAVVLDRLFRRRQEDLRAAQLFVPWHQRYHTAIEGHETMKRDFKEELVVLRREMSKLRRGGKDTEEYIKRKKQNWLDQVKKQREKEPAWTEMVERLGGSVLPQVMRQIKKKARAAGKGDAADSEGKLKERSGVSSSKKRAYNREGREWAKSGYDPAATRSEKTALKERLRRIQKKKFSHKVGATTVGHSGGSTKNYMHPERGWDPPKHFPSR